MTILEKLLGGGKQGGHMPVKRTLNLANVGEKPVSPVIAVISVLLVILAASLFSKFAVIDRFAEVARINRENYNLKQQIDTISMTIESYVDMAREHAHYTYEDLTADERALVDRSEIMDLIRTRINPLTPVSAWSVAGNQVKMRITGYSLESVNNMVTLLEADPLVESCSVATASNTTSVSGDLQTEMIVTADINVFLKSANRRLKTE